MITSFFFHQISKFFGLCIIWVFRSLTGLNISIKYAHNGWSCDLCIFHIPEVNIWVRILKFVMLRTLGISSGFPKFQYLHFSDISMYFLINPGAHSWLFSVQVIFSILWNLAALISSAWISFDLSLMMCFVTFNWKQMTQSLLSDQWVNSLAPGKRGSYFESIFIPKIKWQTVYNG